MRPGLVVGCLGTTTGARYGVWNIVWQKRGNYFSLIHGSIMGSGIIWFVGTDTIVRTCIMGFG